MAWKEYFIYSATFTSLASGTGVTFTDNEVRIDSDSPFEFIKTMYFPVTARVRVRYRDDTNARYLMKGAMDLRTIGGCALYSMAPGNPTPPGFLPYVWPIPYIIPSATTFTVSVADFSGLSYTLRMNFHGSKIRPEAQAPWAKEWRARVPTVYPIVNANPNTLTVAANATVPFAISTDNDSHFLVKKITGARTGECLVTIKDGDRDRQWMDNPVHFDNLVGNGHFPNILPSPRFVRRGATISGSVQDLSGASNTVEINFEGEKLYE